MKTPNTTLVRYVAVRKAEGEPEWFDMDTLSGAPRYVRAKVEYKKVSLREWSKLNPVKRIAKIEIREVEDAST